MSICAIIAFIRAMRSGEPLSQMAFRRRSTPIDASTDWPSGSSLPPGGLRRRLRIVVASGEAVRYEARLARDEHVVGLDGEAIGQQPDDFGYVRIFEKNQLIAFFAEGRLVGRRKAGGGSSRCRLVAVTLGGFARRDGDLDRSPTCLDRGYGCGSAHAETHDEDGIGLLETDAAHEPLHARGLHRVRPAARQREADRRLCRLAGDRRETRRGRVEGQLEAGFVRAFAEQADVRQDNRHRLRPRLGARRLSRPDEQKERRHNVECDRARQRQLFKERKEASHQIGSNENRISPKRKCGRRKGRPHLIDKEPQ
jgi:hypothetical protein